MICSSKKLSASFSSIAYIIMFVILGFFGQAEANMESVFVRDFPIKNSLLMDKMRLLNRGVAAEHGSVIMLHYHDVQYKTGTGPGDHWLYFRDMHTGVESQLR